ncbi:MAG: ATP synthase subunit C [Sphaerochaetaceae bacterium]|nr:ATP synthase subunit C [Sphaerochaetaceae bacterium]
MLLKIILPLVFVVLITLPLIKVFRGKATKKSAKTRLYTHISLFFALVALVFIWQLAGTGVLAAEDEEVVTGFVGSIAQGLGFLAAALATGMSSLGAGIAVAAAAPAAIGAFSENEKNFGKSLIFVALGEGVAIYGLLISILIIGSLG